MIQWHDWTRIVRSPAIGEISGERPQEHAHIPFRLLHAPVCTILSHLCIKLEQQCSKHKHGRIPLIEKSRTIDEMVYGNQEDKEDPKQLNKVKKIGKTVF